MSKLANAFSFRLSDEENSILDALAHRLGCKRGEALRHLLRQQSESPRITGAGRANGGQFSAHGCIFYLKLRSAERDQ